MELIRGKLEHILDTSAKVAGLTNRQYQEWRQIECLEKKGKSGRSRSTPKRRKTRKETPDHGSWETSAERRDRQRAKDEEKRRQEKQEKRTEEQKQKAEQREREREEKQDGWAKAMRRERKMREKKEEKQNKRSEEKKKKRRRREKQQST